VMHDSPMWPIHGEYECRTCGRRYPVLWAGTAKRGLARISPPLRIFEPVPGLTYGRSARVRPMHLPLAFLPLVILLAILFASLAQAADATIVESTAGASMAFARYTAGLEQASPWKLETIEIDASLPKLQKAGRLRAVRRLLPFGKPEYQVLELEGDKTVRQQVIVRYLSADVRAAEIPAANLAVTPANYRFRFKGAVKSGGSVAYAFLITPRKNREGLIKGELWLDAETGAVVRQSGYLVKRPSIFVKRVDVTRETALRDGLADMRVTHLSIDTRLVGRAELTILERPWTASDRALAPAIAER
jgi:hypothetical protein